MIAIPNMSKPKSCHECPIAKSYLDCLMEKKYVCPIGHTDDCPLIEIDENNPMLLEFLNEFDKWRAYKELIDSIRMAQKKGEANDR